MKITHGKFDDNYFPDIRESNMPLNIQLAGVTRPSKSYYTDIIARNYQEGCYQLEYIISGKGYIEIGDQVTIVCEGDFFFINKYIHRIVYSDKINPMKKIYVCVSGEFMDGIVKAYNMDFPLIVRKLNIFENLRAILRICKKAAAFTPEVADKIGNEILEILRMAYYNDNSKKVTSAGYNIAENIMMYIDSNFTRKFTIEDITNTFYMCKTQLIKHFKKHYGITPMKYVQEKRIEASKHYLKSTDIPITSIYSSVGFSDAKYFSLAFKKHTGMSPKEYRRAFAEKN